MSAVSERMEGAIRRDDGNPLTVLYGEATGDSFIGRDLVVRTIEEELLEHLRAIGFERIVFSSRSRRLAYTLDRRSQELTQIVRPNEDGNTGATFRHFGGHSSLGNRRMRFGPPTQTMPENLEQLSNQSLALVIGTLNRWIKDTAYRTALVIVNAESWFEFADAPQALASAIRTWERPDHDNHNRVIMVYGVGTVDELDVQAHQVGAGELQAFIRNHRRGNRVSWDGAVREVDYAHEEEYDRLLQLVRTRFQLDAEWKELRAANGRRLLAVQMAADTPKKLIDKWYRQLEARQPRLSVASFRSGDKPLMYQGEVETRTAQERLDAMSGLEEIKALLAAIVNDAKEQAQLLAEGVAVKPSSHHMIFKGNPGTGKTEVAMLVGEILRDAGILRRGHTHVADAATLVADHIGGTYGRVNSAIDDAMDGVLFIDEAYQLVDKPGGANAFGKQATDTLVRRTDVDRGRFIAIAAGYPDDMQEFVASNPGLPSRFPHQVNFPDYEPPILHKILLNFLQESMIPVSSEASAMLLDAVEGIYRTRTRGFGNAREMRNLRDALRLRRAQRRQTENLPLDTPLLPEDLPSEYETFLTRELPDLNELMDELNRLDGLTEVKAKVNTLVNRIRYQRAYGAGDPIRAQNLVFVGPPGTGKTTVAQMIGRIYQALGLLPRSEVTETKSADLVGQYRGHTAPQTLAVLDKAMGGVLFIDEAYSLYDGGEGDFGQRVIDTLTHEILVRRGNLAVIIAGYEVETDRLLKSNPGLKRRFDQTIHFRYSDAELMEIFLKQVNNRNRLLGENVAASVQDILIHWRAALGPQFGNVGAIKDILLERMEDNLVNRVLANPVLTEPDFLRRYEVEDVPNVSEL